MDSLMGICEWVSDSRESAWLANPCELGIRITGKIQFKRYIQSIRFPTAIFGVEQALGNFLGSRWANVDG